MDKLTEYEQTVLEFVLLSSVIDFSNNKDYDLSQVITDIYDKIVN